MKQDCCAASSGVDVRCAARSAGSGGVPQGGTQLLGSLRCNRPYAQASRSAVCQKGERRITPGETNLAMSDGLGGGNRRQSVCGNAVEKGCHSRRLDRSAVANDLAEDARTRIVRGSSRVAWDGLKRWAALTGPGNLWVIVESRQPQELKLRTKGRKRQQPEKHRPAISATLRR
jgi:hypothetical protein